jgi:hypothetical protein
MAVNKYITNNAGVLTEILAPVTSAGAADAGKLPALNSNGKLDQTVMPTGIGPDTLSVVASEALTAGNFVNLWNNAGAFNVRKADATTAGKEAHGFVTASVANGANATVYPRGTNDQVTGLTPGPVYLATTAGGVSGTAPSASGNVVQRIGFAASATTIAFQFSPPIVLA